jgi:hypothetical protein
MNANTTEHMHAEHSPVLDEMLEQAARNHGLNSFVDSRTFLRKGYNIGMSRKMIGVQEAAAEAAQC